MKARVTVRLKEGVLDPQGNAVLHAAHSLGEKNVQGIKVGKIFEIEWAGSNPEEAKERLSKLSETLLANTVIENFSIEIL